MTSKRKTDMDGSGEADLEALLSSRKSDSIIDHLLAFSTPAESASNEWDRAVAQRLETILAQRMRALIGSDGRRDAA